jgi:hypothetical protein
MEIKKALAGFWYIKDANGLLLGTFQTFRRAALAWRNMTGEVLSLDD